MPFIPASNGVRVCMRFDNSGQLACNVFYVKVEDPIDATLLNQIGAAFVDWWDTNMKSITAPQISLQAVEVTDAEVSGGVGVEYTTGLPLNGTNAANCYPQNVTAAVKLSTGMVGRSRRGRSYVIGMPVGSANLAGFLTPTAQSNIDTAYEALISMLQALDWPLVIASFVSGGAPRLAALLTPVIAASVNLAIDSQRRRLPERGA